MWGWRFYLNQVVCSYFHTMISEIYLGFHCIILYCILFHCIAFLKENLGALCYKNKTFLKAWS